MYQAGTWKVQPLLTHFTALWLTMNLDWSQNHSQILLSSLPNMVTVLQSFWLSIQKSE